MTDQAIPYGRKTQRAPAVAEVDVLWITAGLSCDGDSIAVTSATQPAIEDLCLEVRRFPRKNSLVYRPKATTR